jgi:hypothetical protein
MTKQFLTLAIGVAALSAQTLQMGHGFQHPGWIAAPGSAPITVRSTRPDGQDGPVAGKPFSASEVRRATQTLADGTHVEHVDTSAFYRDDRGRMRTESATHILIYDPAAGYTYHLDPARKEYRKAAAGKDSVVTIAVVGDSTWINQTTEKSSSPVRTVTGPLPFHSEPVMQPVNERLPAQILSGIPVKGTRITMTIPAGTFGNDRDVKVVNERWYSDDLQVLVKSTNSDPRFGETSYELTDIVQGAPNPALFQVPADYALRASDRGRR